jgi:hypothetical protein
MKGVVMKIRNMAYILGSMMLLLAFWIPGAQADTINSSADAKVRLGDDNNYGDDSSAVVGTDINAAQDSRLYVGFSLPTLDSSLEYASATLYGYYYWDTWDNSDREFSWHRVDDDVWNEATINGDNAPGYDSAAFANWTPSGSSSGAGGHNYSIWQSWDILNVLKSETDGNLTIVLKQTDETLNGGFESFRTKEYDPSGSDPVGSRQFHIEYTTRLINNNNTPVPEPSTLLLLGLGMAGLVSARKRLHF